MREMTKKSYNQLCRGAHWRKEEQSLPCEEEQKPGGGGAMNLARVSVSETGKANMPGRTTA